MAIGTMLMIAAAAGGIAKAAGTILGGRKTGDEGVPEQSASLAKRGAARTTMNNMRLGNMFLQYQSESEKRDLLLTGQNERDSAYFAAAGFDRKANADYASAQSQMFDAQRSGREVSSEYQAKAAGSGFFGGDLVSGQGEIDDYGKYRASMFGYGGEIARDTSRNAAGASRAEGDYALDYSKFQSDVVGGHSRLQQMINATTAGGQSAALLAESRGYKMAASAARTAARKKRAMSYVSAGSTLLGTASDVGGMKK